MIDFADRIADLSPEKLALLEHRLRGKSTPVSSNGIVPQTRETKRFPASFAQERLWFLDQLQPGSSFYNVPAVVPLHIPLHLGALEWSLNEIVRRHEVLRTTFAMVDGQPVQSDACCVASSGAVAVSRADAATADGAVGGGRSATAV